MSSVQIVVFVAIVYLWKRKKKEKKGCGGRRGGKRARKDLYSSSLSLHSTTKRRKDSL